MPDGRLRGLCYCGPRGGALTFSQAGGDREHERPTGGPVPIAASTAQFEEWQIALHGRRAVYRIAGSGPAVVLIHGMLNSSSHWQSVALNLARDHTVLAPDLIGHGDSAALGAHAASIRDLMAAIGIDRASIVGHSLGGGVAMQFFYQFPQRVERLALVSSGGLGHEVSPMLRTAALPGFSTLLSATIRPRLLRALAGAGVSLRERRVGAGVYLQAIARALRPLENAEARQAFLQTLRSVIDARGQRVSATDRLYLLETMPTLIVWGERDNTIPLEHGRLAHETIPHSVFETIPDAAHFPHLEDPERLSQLLRSFIRDTRPGLIEDSDWGAVLAGRSPRSRRLDDLAGGAAA
jgi:pimeloyl-ACP methyl ester carboxylesterase